MTVMPAKPSSSSIPTQSAVSVDSNAATAITNGTVRLLLEHLDGQMDTIVVPVPHDALPSKAIKALYVVAKSHLTRPEKVGLAIHLYKMELYRVTDGGADAGAVPDKGLLAALAAHPKVDDNPTAFFDRYGDVLAGDGAVLFKIVANKQALSRIAKFMTMASGLTVNLILSFAV